MNAASSTPLPWSSAWITGASSGIGWELALRLAAGGCAVAASARSADKLDELARQHRLITPYPLDVRDADANQRTVAAMIAASGVPDLVILNAGIGIFKSAARLDATHFRDAFEINVVGMGNGLAAVVPPMVARGSGQIALMGSLAGYRGFPRAVHYAPTKAAIRSMADCLRFDLEPKGIDVSLVTPGYIETPLTHDLEVPMPGLMPLAPAIDKIMAGLARKKFLVAVPWHIAMLVRMGAKVSNPTYFAVTRWLMSRGEP